VRCDFVRDRPLRHNAGAQFPVSMPRLAFRLLDVLAEPMLGGNAVSVFADVYGI
jgi:hypothetical protein